MRTSLIFIIVTALSLVPDAIALPRAPWRRAPLAWVAHILALLFLYAFFMLLSARPLFSALCMLALVAVMGLISNAKLQTLREPLVFSDLSLFQQAFTHPRFYWPFIRLRVLVADCVGLVVLVLVWWFDPPVAPHPWAMPVLVMAACLGVGYYLVACLPLALDIETDQCRHGFFVTFVAYMLNGLRLSTIQGFRTQTEAGPFARDDGALAPIVQAVNPNPADTPGATGEQPDVIVIQCESYFDARRASAAINPSAYVQLDRACRESIAWGELTVPTWGASTMRTEFSFLTGLPPAKLGYARFYPYVFLRRPCPSLPGWFRRHGYHTLAIHPYFVDFFGRDRVFPLLHFERFLDIVHFKQAPCAGPFVTDPAVADAILAALEEKPGQAPRFIFAITMENHGPLYLEKVQRGEAEKYHTLGEEPKWAELTIYLRHVVNTDAMISRLLDGLRARSRPAVVCFYGDHVPALSDQFRALGVMPKRSDYFIWRNFGAQPAAHQNVQVEALGSMLLAAMRSPNTPIATASCRPDSATA